MEVLHFPFTPVEPGLGESAFLPFVPITLQLNSRKIEAAGLLDTGATVNVLPYSVGLELGAHWDEQNVPLSLTGNLANFEANALILKGEIDGLPPVRLAFAWTKSNAVPLILGQTNFFMT